LTNKEFIAKNTATAWGYHPILFYKFSASSSHW